MRAAGSLTIGNRTVGIVSVSRQEINIRVHWMPSYITDDFFEIFFQRFGKVLSVTREHTVIGANVEKRNGVRVVKIETDELMKGTIPHMLKFEGGISALVTIQGRPPLCLKCNQVGHMRRDCVPQQETQRISYAAAAAPRQTPVPTAPEPPAPTAPEPEESTPAEPNHTEGDEDESVTMDDTVPKNTENGEDEVTQQMDDTGPPTAQQKRFREDDDNDENNETGFDIDNYLDCSTENSSWESVKSAKKGKK